MSFRPTHLLALLSVSLSAPFVGAQVVWSSTSQSDWLTGSNWTGGAVPTASQIAQFGANPLGSGGVGINFSNTTNAGIQVNGQRIQEVGAVEISSARTAGAMIIGNSSGTAGATGQFRLNGVTVNGVANTIIRNNSTRNLTIQDRQANGDQTMSVILGNATTNVVNVDSTGFVSIGSSITGVGRSLTYNANGGGDLRLSGINTFNGGITINGGTQGGRLRIDSVPAIPSAGNITVNTGGRLTLNVAGVYGTTSQILTLNPNQTTNSAFDILSDATVTWQGTVSLSAAARIDAPGAAGNLTLAGIVSGTGTLIKTGAGTLNLVEANTFSGATNVNVGTLRLGASAAINSTPSITLASGTTFNVSAVSGGFVLGGSTNQTLQGTGTVTGGVTVAGNGTIRGDSGTGTGTLTTGNVTVQSGGAVFANLGASGTSSTLALAGNSLDFKTGSVLRLDDATGFASSGSFNLATFTNGNTILVNAAATTDGDILGEYLVGTGDINSRPVSIDVSALPTLTMGDRLTLQRTGNNLQLMFTPVPEPATLLAVCAVAVGGVAGVRRLRRLRRKAVAADVTPAA